MSTKIRLARKGRKNLPCYSIVVASAQAPRDGKFIEKIGFYSPTLPQKHEKRLKIDEQRVNHWLSKGAVPTDIVVALIKKSTSVSLPVKLEKKIIRDQKKKLKT